MNVLAPLLLRKLRSEGFEVRAEGVALAVRPAAKLTGAQRESVIALKQDLLRLLWDEADAEAKADAGGTVLPQLPGAEVAEPQGSFRGLGARGARWSVEGGGTWGHGKGHLATPFDPPGQGTALREDRGTERQAALKAAVRAAAKPQRTIVRPKTIADRRLVLLVNDEQHGAVERVLAVLSGSTVENGEPQASAHRLALVHARLVAAEWEHPKNGVGWRRFLWVRYAGPNGEDLSHDAD